MGLAKRKAIGVRKKVLQQIQTLATSAILAGALASCALAPEPRPLPTLDSLSWYTAEADKEANAKQALEWAMVVDITATQAAIQQALKNNPDLQANAARWQAALAQRNASYGSRFPAIDAGLNSQRRDANGAQTDTANVALSLNWELDVWGRVANSALASKYSAEQQSWLYLQAQRSLAARTVSGVLDAVAAKQQLSLAQQRQQAVDNNLHTIEEGFNRGIRSALDLYSAQAEAADAARNTASQQKAAADSHYSLALLLGSNASQVDKYLPTSLPTVETTLPSKFSSHHLIRRPDLQAAEAAVKAQQRNAQIAWANRLPRLSLSGDYGASNEQLGEVLAGNNEVWSVLGGLSAPLFKGRQLANEQKRQGFLLDAAIAEYKQTALRAFIEIEQSLSNEHWLARQLTAAKVADAASAQAEQQAKEQYLSGLAPISTWLQAQRIAFDRSGLVIQLATLQAQNRLNLHLALGGDVGIKTYAQ